MSKELEAWKDIKWSCYKEGKLDKQFNIVETALKALKIIKEKGIDTEIFYQFETYEDYKEYCEYDEIFRNLYGDYTQEEFNLLKEALL